MYRCISLYQITCVCLTRFILSSSVVSVYCAYHFFSTDFFWCAGEWFTYEPSAFRQCKISQRQCQYTTTTTTWQAFFWRQTIATKRWDRKEWAARESERDREKAFSFCLQEKLLRNLITLNMKVCEYHVVWRQQRRRRQPWLNIDALPGFIYGITLYLKWHV